ncbi:hypothetical protein AWC29_29540 [Mycobacterium triplex]|uniref:Uncharacterized protein n=1 Tax=Mycobacterium triplex TaxID=47839 RepID=A0ABX3VXR4_9MYCO|nr:hypothetical protein AWC29_29540 [Mycobacterium triplex]
MWLLAAVGVATAAVVMAATGTRRSVRLTSADSVPVTGAVSVTPAPGWSGAGPIPVIGTFNELLNTSTRQTAFVNFRQNDNATLQVDNDGGAMISSML